MALGRVGRRARRTLSVVGGPGCALPCLVRPNAFPPHPIAGGCLRRRLSPVKYLDIDLKYCYGIGSFKERLRLDKRHSAIYESSGVTMSLLAQAFDDIDKRSSEDRLFPRPGHLRSIKDDMGKELGTGSALAIKPYRGDKDAVKASQEVLASERLRSEHIEIIRNMQAMKVAILKAPFASKILCRTEGAGSGRPRVHDPRVFKEPAHAASFACDRTPRPLGTERAKRRQESTGCICTDVARPTSSGHAGTPGFAPGHPMSKRAPCKPVYAMVAPAEARILAAPRAPCSCMPSVACSPTALFPLPRPGFFHKPSAGRTGRPTAHALTRAATRFLGGQSPHAAPASHMATQQCRLAHNLHCHRPPPTRRAVAFLFQTAYRTDTGGALCGPRTALVAGHRMCGSQAAAKPSGRTVARDREARP